MFNIYTLLTISLGWMFLFSSFSKFSNLRNHFIIIKNYDIVSESQAKFFSRIDPSFELVASIMMILGIYTKYALLLVLLLITLYSISIVINLLKGRTNIECGCGGLLGSHNLSWKLIYRNALLILMISFLYTYTIIVNGDGSAHIDWNYHFIFVSLSLLLFIKSIQYLINIRSITEGVH